MDLSVFARRSAKKLVLAGLGMFAIGLFPVRLSEAQSANSQPVFKAVIEGTVRYRSTNQPMTGVRVFLLNPSELRPGNATPFVDTDTQGNFSFTVSSPGRYRLLPQRSGFVYARPDRVRTIQAGVVVSVIKESVPRIDLAMVREGIITGEIVDPTGKALSGVPTNVLLRTYNNVTGKLGWSTLGPLGVQQSVTNDRGEYRYFGLQPGDYIISAPGSMVTPMRYYPGVEDISRAALVHVDASEEKRLSRMTIEDRSKSVPVHFRFQDPERKMTNTGFMMGSQIVSMYSFPSGRVEPEIVLSLSRGHYELTLRATSRDNNDLLYAPVKVDVGDEELFLDVPFKPGIRITGSLKLLDSDGKSLDPKDIQCLLVPETESAASQAKPPGCIGGQFSPGLYRLTMYRMPPDAYVVSAKSGDRNVLADGILIERETPLDIVLTTPGSTIKGTVTNEKGEPLSAAVVALVPDAPLRNAEPLYRSDISTYDGTFELRGIAPGNYRLFAWPDLPGAAYLNADFMKDYEAKGTPIRFETTTHASIDVKVVE
jgi:hypothetical protein